MKTLSWWLALLLTPATTETANFDTEIYGRTPAGWFAAARPGAPPAWRIIKDPSAPTQPYVLAHVPPPGGGNPLSVAILEGPEARDGEISVKFKALSGGAEQKAGLVWRYRDAGNYYFVRADAGGRNVVLYRVENGNPVPLAPRGRSAHDYTVPHHVSADNWSILKVVFKGPRLSVYYGHRRILQAEDGHFTGAGRVGLWTRASSAAHFDNFRLVRKQ